jgi:hypothetical protein
MHNPEFEHLQQNHIAAPAVGICEVKKNGQYVVTLLMDVYS